MSTKNKSLLSALLIVSSISTLTMSSASAELNSTGVTKSVKPVVQVVANVNEVKIAEDLLTKNEVIIRNNKILSDDEYNSTNYFTSKIKTENIVIPKDIEKELSKTYFLVEEGYNYMLYKDASYNSDVEATEVKDEYNYKIVDYIPGKKEYIFNNQDLVKDFDGKNSRSVNISLVGELKNGEKITISQNAYIFISGKEDVLQNLKSKKDNDYSYYGYYSNSDYLEKYLETKGEKLSRKDYQASLTKSLTKVKDLIQKNVNEKNEMLMNIKKESDLNENLDAYIINVELNSLLQNIKTAINNQLYKSRSLELIESIN